MSTVTTSIVRQIEAAYIRMAEDARYRPAAPSDGVGNITKRIEELDLLAEANTYAARWWTEEDDHDFFVGCCNYVTRPATIYAIEAARLMCGGSDANPYALRLLRLAMRELEDLGTQELE